MRNSSIRAMHRCSSLEAVGKLYLVFTSDDIDDTCAVIKRVTEMDMASRLLANALYRIALASQNRPCEFISDDDFAFHGQPLVSTLFPKASSISEGMFVRLTVNDVGIVRRR